MNVIVSLSATPMAHPPRSNPFLRSSSDAPPFPCITPSTVTCVMVVSFHGRSSLLAGFLSSFDSTGPRRRSHRSQQSPSGEFDPEDLEYEANQDRDLRQCARVHPERGGRLWTDLCSRRRNASRSWVESVARRRARSLREPSRQSCVRAGVWAELVSDDTIAAFRLRHAHYLRHGVHPRRPTGDRLCHLPALRIGVRRRTTSNARLGQSSGMSPERGLSSDSL